MSGNDVELEGVVVENPQEVRRAKPAVRKENQVEKPTGFSNQRELVVACQTSMIKSHQNHNTEPKLQMCREIIYSLFCLKLFVEYD